MKRDLLLPFLVACACALDVVVFANTGNLLCAIWACVLSASLVLHARAVNAEGR